MQLDDVVEEYMYHCMAKGFTPKTIKNKHQEYKLLLQFLKGKRGITLLESVTIHDLKAYIRQKHKDGLQASSIKSVHKIIAAFNQWCVEEGYIKENLMKSVEAPKLPKKVLKTFTPIEVMDMIESFSFKNYIEARNKAIIAILADCGLRAIEVRGLKAFNVKDTVILVNGKGNKERVVFISPALKKILIKYERLRNQFIKENLINNDHYFLTYQGSDLSNVALYNVIIEAGKRAGIKGVRVSPHTFRHFYSVQSLSAGIDLYSLSRLLGHSDVSTTQRYLQSLSDEELITKAVATSPLMNLNRR